LKGGKKLVKGRGVEVGYLGFPYIMGGGVCQGESLWLEVKRMRGFIVGGGGQTEKKRVVPGSSKSFKRAKRLVFSGHTENRKGQS